MLCVCWTGFQHKADGGAHHARLDCRNVSLDSGRRPRRAGHVVAILQRAGHSSKKPANDPRRSVTRIGAVGYAFTRSPDAADLSIAAMTSWRRTASAKSGTV